MKNDRFEPDQEFPSLPETYKFADRTVTLQWDGKDLAVLIAYKDGRNAYFPFIDSRSLTRKYSAREIAERCALLEPEEL